jgi:cytochrome c553
MTRQRLARIAWLAAGALSLGFLFLWSGLFNVSASRGHWKGTEWLLTFAMHNSVRTHASGISAPPLNDENLMILGAGHFHSGCAYCHGAPGVPISPIAQAMLPPPPDLVTAPRHWRTRELFWIVKNGIKYTGMPAWADPQREDEVWAVVAFLHRLPALDEQAYRDLALGDLTIPPQSGRDLASTASSVTGGCERCHGSDRHAPRSRLVPILNGQTPEYLAQSLDEYARGRRPSGIMRPLADELSREEVARVAAYFAGLSMPPRTADAHAPAGASIERGRTLAENGDVATKVPSCTACHGPDALRTYPRLAGQNAPYMANRLRLWKAGMAPGSDGAAIMAPIAAAMTNRQIEDVVAYFASLSPAQAR